MEQNATLLIFARALEFVSDLNITNGFIPLERLFAFPDLGAQAVLSSPHV
jgi:hypothetical protein